MRGGVRAAIALTAHEDQRHEGRNEDDEGAAAAHFTTARGSAQSEWRKRREHRHFLFVCWRLPCFDFPPLKQCECGLGRAEGERRVRMPRRNADPRHRD